MAESVKTISAAECILSRTFDASREDVWDAFTQPEHLKHWFGIPGSSMEIAHYDLKPDGIFHYCMKFPDGRTMWARNIFREVAPPQRLAWLNAFSDAQGGVTPNPWLPNMDYPLETLHTAEFAEQDGKTVLTFTVAPHNATEAQAKVFASVSGGMKMGLGGVFDLLAKYLAQRS